MLVIVVITETAICCTVADCVSIQATSVWKTWCVHTTFLLCATTISINYTPWGRKKEPVFFHVHLFSAWQALVIFFTYIKESISYTHPFNGPLSGTTQVSRYQKGKTNLDFTGARDSEWQWHQLGRMQVCTLLQTDNHASTSPLSFLQAGCPSCRPTNSVKALKAKSISYNSMYLILACVKNFVVMKLKLQT